MLRTTLTAAWSRKRRLVGTALAVILGAAFLSTTLVLGDTARGGFEVAFGEANAGTDAFVRAADELSGGEATVRPPLDADLVDDVAAVDGVADVVPTVEGTAQVLDADGTPIGGDGPPTVAESWIDDPGRTGWELVEGRAPDADGEVVVDRGTARTAGVGPGDQVTVLVPDPIEVTVVGVASFAGNDSLGGTTYVAFTTATAQQRLLGSDDLVSGIIVAGEPGIAEDQLVQRLSAALPDEAEAITGTALTEEMQAEIERDFLGFLTVGLLVFAGIALLVAAFSIFNTFSILVAQRTRESALLRALGAGRAQVLLAALAESVMVGLAGAAVGAAVGVAGAAGLLALMDAAGFGLPTDGLVLSTSALLTTVAVGVAVTAAGGVVPAWRSSRVAPLAALRDAEIDAGAAPRARGAVGAVVTAAGVVGLVVAGRGPDRMSLAGIAAVAVVVGVLLLAAVVARPAGRLLGAPLSRFGVSGELARRNAVRNPRRTASTAAALLVGVGVVSLFTVFGASVSQSIEDEVTRTFAGDLVLQPAGGAFSGAGLDADVAARLGGLDEVEVAGGLGFGAARIDGRQEGVGFGDPVALAQVAELDVVAGELAAVDDRSIAVADEYAADHGYAIGDRIEVGFVDGAAESLVLAATYDRTAIGGSVLVPEAAWARHVPQASHFLVMVDLADGVAVADGRAAIETVTAGVGGPDVLDRAEFIERQAAEIDVLLNIVYGLLVVAIVIALMGIANTLSLSVHERTRELGLLRAVGQTRRQLRSMVRGESVIVATFGAAGGVGLGVLLGWGLMRALQATEGIGTFAVPVGPLLVVLLVGAGVGVLAAWRPARRASRLDVLDAIAVE